MKTGWTTKKLGELCKLIGGGTPSIHVAEYYDGSIPWATVRDMNCREIRETERTITKEGLANSASNVIPAGNVVISTHVGLGKVCFVENDTAINQDLKGVIPKDDNLDRTFLYYWFLSIADFLIANGTGSTVKGIKLEFVTNLEMPLPPLKEQQRIVAKIDAAFAKIDTLKAYAEKNLAKARELFQSALDKAMRPEKGWTENRLGEVCEFVGGGTPSIHVAEYYDGKIPWATVRDMNCRVIRETERTITQLGLDNSASHIIPAGNVVISTHVGLGKVCFVERDTAINQDLKGVIPKDNDLDRAFLYYWFLSIADFLIANGTGSTVKGVKLEFVKNLTFPLPPLSEQNRIVARLDTLSSKLETLKRNYARLIADCAEMRQAILREAFEGRL